MKAAILGRPILIIAIVSLIAAGCSPRKNTAANRRYQEFITRYNIHYNGQSHYTETLDAMEEGYEDDFTGLIPVHPADARGDKNLPQPTGDFTRSIEKAQKSIQLRSIKRRPKPKPGHSRDNTYRQWMKRSEYNPFIHNSWLMMGRSQYMNGDFDGAAATFMYITKHFQWLPETVTEAKLWQARAYCGTGWLFEAENIISGLDPSQLTDNELKRLYYIVSTILFTKLSRFDEAAAALSKAIEFSPGKRHARMEYLLAQLLARAGKTNEASIIFGKIADKSNIPYRTKLNARIMQTEVASGEKNIDRINQLKKIARLTRNKPYLDQINYAIGNLYLWSADTAGAIESYRKAIEKSQREGVEKAMAQIALGKIYFEKKRYDLAQPLYAAAVTLLPESYPGIDSIKLRSDVLDELAVHSNALHLNDSLLTLSEMSPEQRLRAIEKIIADLKKQEKKEAELQARNEHRLQSDGAENTLYGAGNALSPGNFTLNSDRSWYFYNPAVRNAGKTEFQRRWGNRKLEDNWRRRDKNDYFTGENNEPQSSGEQGREDTPAAASTAANDPHSPEFYLRQIPQTDIEIASTKEIIQGALFNIGVILKDRLHDFTSSAEQFTELNNRFPDNIYRLEAYYNLYLMGIISGDFDEAARWQQAIVDQFPESEYGKAMNRPDYLSSIADIAAKQEQIYDLTYRAFLENRNGEVHRATEMMLDSFPMSDIMPKFLFIDALSYVADRNNKRFRERLEKLVEQYPAADVTPLASAYLAGLNSGRIPQAGGSNQTGMIFTTRLSDSPAQESSDPTSFNVDFNFDYSSPQIIVFTFPKDSVSANQLLFDVARYNFNRFTMRDFELEQISHGNLGLLLIHGFKNLEEAQSYIKTVSAGEPRMRLPRNVRPVVISESDFNLLLAHSLSFDDYFRQANIKTYKAVQEITLPPELFGPAEPPVETNSTKRAEKFSPMPPPAPKKKINFNRLGSEGDDDLLH